MPNFNGGGFGGGGGNFGGSPGFQSKIFIKKKKTLTLK